MNIEKAKFDFKTLLFTLFFPLSLLYCDYIVKVGIYKEIAASEFLYTLLFSIAFGLLFCLLSSLFSKRINTIIALSLSFVICVYYSFQYLYFLCKPITR